MTLIFKTSVDELKLQFCANISTLCDGHRYDRWDWQTFTAEYLDRSDIDSDKRLLEIISWSFNDLIALVIFKNKENMLHLPDEQDIIRRYILGIKSNISHLINSTLRSYVDYVIKCLLVDEHDSFLELRKNHGITFIE